MKIIQPSYRILTETDPIKKIERIARVCYKSEDKIKLGSDIKMVKALAKRKHTAMLEHASVCIEVDPETYRYISKTADFFSRSIAYGDSDYGSRYITDKWPERCYLQFTKDAHVGEREEGRCLISGNIRAWFEFVEKIITMNSFYYTKIPKYVFEVLVDATGGENSIFLDLLKESKTVCNPEDIFMVYTKACMEQKQMFCRQVTDFKQLKTSERWVHENISVDFEVDRGTSHEMVRMRECSFAQESTRYCAYQLDKFSGNITVIEPCFFKEGTKERFIWESACAKAEEAYMCLTRELKIPAEQARAVLPTSLKTEIVMTANLREWHHILSLRACDSTGPAHPQIKEVMIPLLKELQASEDYKDFFQDLKIISEKV